MKKKGKVSIFLLLLAILFLPNLIFSQATGISLDSYGPKFSSNTKQTLTVNGTIQGIGSGDLPIVVGVYDTGGTAIGTALATANPFTVLITPSSYSFPTGATTEYYLVESSGGNSSTQNGKIYVNDQPLSTGDLTVTISPDPVSQGATVTIHINSKYPIKRSGLAITITDASGKIHIISSSHITYNNGNDTDDYWNDATITWTIPTDMPTGKVKISLSGSTATGIASSLSDIGTDFTVQTAISTKPIIMYPAPSHDAGGDHPETVVSQTPKFHWSTVLGAVKTYLEFWEMGPLGTGGAAPDPTSTSPDFSVEVHGNPPWEITKTLSKETEYYWRVVVEDAGGGKMTSEMSSLLSIDMRPITFFSPEADSRIKWGKGEVWPSDKQIKTSLAPGDPKDNSWKYTLDMSRDPSFTIIEAGPFSGTVVGNTVEFSPTNPGTVVDGDWYLRVRATDKRGNIDCTTIRRVAIDNTPLTPPQLVSPPHKSFTNETRPFFSWEADPKASKYIIEFAYPCSPGGTPEPANFKLSYEVKATTTTGYQGFRPPAALPVSSPTTLFNWRVKTVDSAGNISDPSQFRSLVIDTTIPDGSKIKLEEPENMNLIGETSPTFKWKWTETQQDDLEGNNGSVNMYKAVLQVTKSLSDWSSSQVVTQTVEVDSSYVVDIFNSSVHPSSSVYNEMEVKLSASLTPETTYYWRVIPIDRAGNKGSPSAINTFSLNGGSDSLPPPVIKSPSNGDVVSSKNLPVTVEINPPPLTPGDIVRTYSVKIYAVVNNLTNDITSKDLKLLAGPIEVPPGQNEITMSVTLGDDDGRYTLLATVVDEAGTESDPANSTPVKIILDRHSPQVDHIVITSQHEGTTSYPDEGISSKILVQVVFSEQMKTEDDNHNVLNPDITIYPEKGYKEIKVEPLPAPQKSWSPTGKAWTGIATIPAGNGYNGKASLSIGGQITDLAGRRLSPNPTFYQDYFYIDTAPSLKIKAFYNPTDERDIIISVESSEKLKMVPMVEVDFNGKESTMYMNMVHDNIYTGVYTIEGGKSGIIEIKAYGTDYAGNTGFNKYSFQVSEVNPLQGYNFSFKSMQLSIPQHSLAKKGIIAILPQEVEKNTSSEKTSFKTSPRIKQAVPEELEVVSDSIYEIGPYTLKFKEPFSLSFKTDAVGKVGIFRYENGNWKYIPSFKLGDKVVGAVDKPGMYVLMKDIMAPRLKSTNISDGEKLSSYYQPIELDWEEMGSGLDKDRVEVEVDGSKVNVNVVGNSIFYRQNRYQHLSEGEHFLKAKVYDQIGNRSETVQLKFYAPKPFEVYDFYFYPNPSSDTDPKIHYVLTQQAEKVDLKIYDKAGKLVVAMHNLDTEAGEHNSLSWDRRNGELYYVANGVYFAKITAVSAGGEVSEKTTKVVILR
jgi:hypothetical protein